MSLKAQDVHGMRTAEVFMKMEAGRISHEDLFKGHAVLLQIDEFDHSTTPLELDTVSVCGFAFDRSPGASTLDFKSQYAAPMEGIIDQAMQAILPHNHHLTSNEGASGNESNIRRGMHANQAINHPYVANTLFLQDAGAAAHMRMLLRMTAFAILDIAKPSDETRYLMEAALSHSAPPIEVDMKRLVLMETFRGSGASMRNPRYTTRLFLTSEREGISEADLQAVPFRRHRFLVDHPGAEAIFEPFPSSDKDLRSIRDVVQGERNVDGVDQILAENLGKDVWEQFCKDTSDFIKARKGSQMETRVSIPEPYPSQYRDLWPIQEVIHGTRKSPWEMFQAERIEEDLSFPAFEP